ncbi:Uncharacterised protein [Bacillus freudenreichii]|nr:Uncharacterised protein [Bacillus freudenreichii]
MKKILIIAAASLSVIVLGLFGAYKYFVHQDELKQAEVEKKAEAAGISEEEFMEQTQLIGGIDYEVDLDKNSTDDEIISVMHKMTHQKVRAEDKWGAIPMTEDTIKQVYEVVSKRDFDDAGLKEDLLHILQKWENNNFLSADEDHNYFWEYQGGTVGRAYDTMSQAEEVEFIRNNFK